MGQDDDLLTESFSRRRRCFTIFQRVTVISNIFFALFAVLLIAIGGLGLTYLKQYNTIYKETIPAGLLVLGIILVGIIAIGLAGSFFKNTKLLLLYFILLLIFVICEFGVGGGAYTLRGQIPTTLEYQWTSLSDSDKNSLQHAYNCCGWWTVYDGPGSSCPSNSTLNHTNTNSSTDGGYAYQELRDILDVEQTSGNSTGNGTTPCEVAIVTYFQSELYIVGTVGILFATLQLLALISSLVVFVFIKIEQYQSKEERF